MDLKSRYVISEKWAVCDNAEMSGISYKNMNDGSEELFSSFQATFRCCNIFFSCWCFRFFFFLIFLSSHAKTYSSRPPCSCISMETEVTDWVSSFLISPPVTWLRGSIVIGWQLEVFWPLFSKHLLPNPSRPLPVEGWSLPPPDDFFMALVRHHCDIIMQHAGAQEDHWTQRPFVPSHSLLARLMRRHSRSRLLMLWFGAFCLLVSQRGQSRVHQWGGRKQFEPANHHVGEIQIIQQDLSSSHEGFMVHPTIVAPNDDLQWQTNSTPDI